MYVYGQQKQLSAVKIIIGINIAVFLVGMLFNNHQAITEAGCLNNAYIRSWELWRLVTSMFIHGDFMHLLFNMYGLWIFGNGLESAIGKRQFLILYFIAGLGGALFWMLATPWSMVEAVRITQDGGGFLYKIPFSEFAQWRSAIGDASSIVLRNSCIGASGAVTGVVLGMALVAPKMRIQLMFPPIPMTLKTFAIGYIIMEIFFSGRNDGIAHSVHVGGGICGFIYLVIVCFRNPTLYFIRERVRLWWYRVKTRFIPNMPKISKPNFFNNTTDSKPKADSYKSYDSSSYKQPETSSVSVKKSATVSENDLLEILLKMDREGIQSLTAEEAEILWKAKQVKGTK